MYTEWSHYEEDWFNNYSQKTEPELTSYKKPVSYRPILARSKIIKIQKKESKLEEILK